MAKNLFVKVGRAPAKCLGTYADDIACIGAQASAASELARAGVDSRLIAFSQEDAADAPKTIAPSEVAKPLTSDDIARIASEAATAAVAAMQATKPAAKSKKGVK